MSEVNYIQIEKDGIRTTIIETDFEANGYKAAGWKPVTTDWTKERKVKPQLDINEHLAVANMVKGAFKKK